MKLYEKRDGKLGRVDIEESDNLAPAMPEKAKELNERLTKMLTEMNAHYPYFNPLYKSKLPHKENIPTVTSETLAGGVAKITFKENGARVVRAQLIYTKSGGERNEEWFPSEASIDGGSVVATLPAGTTHYVFNLIDENNYLVSYPLVKSQKHYKSKHLYSEEALSVAR